MPEDKASYVKKRKNTHYLRIPLCKQVIAFVPIGVLDHIFPTRKMAVGGMGVAGDVGVPWFLVGGRIWANLHRESTYGVGLKA